MLRPRPAQHQLARGHPWLSTWRFWRGKKLREGSSVPLPKSWVWGSPQNHSEQLQLAVPSELSLLPAQGARAVDALCWPQAPAEATCAGGQHRDGDQNSCFSIQGACLWLVRLRAMPPCAQHPRGCAQGQRCPLQRPKRPKIQTSKTPSPNYSLLSTTPA